MGGRRDEFEHLIGPVQEGTIGTTRYGVWHRTMLAFLPHSAAPEGP